MLDDKLRALLKESDEVEEAPTEDLFSKDSNSTSSDTATAVMKAYQDANKWLDIIKESLLMDQGCAFFSNYVHNLAHTMPVRFDKFGDILHTVDMKVPYPATEYIEKEPESVEEAFTMIFSILDAIKSSLREFIKSAQDTESHGMACAAEALLNDIEGEYPPLYRMKRMYGISGNAIEFDKWVANYVSGNFID